MTAPEVSIIHGSFQLGTAIGQPERRMRGAPLGNTPLCAAILSSTSSQILLTDSVNRIGSSVIVHRDPPDLVDFGLFPS